MSTYGPGFFGSVYIILMTTISCTRDELREQNALSDEIVNAITNNPIGDPLDEDELEAELDELQQEKLDEDILKTGNVPVADLGQRMPSVASQERECEEKYTKTHGEMCLHANFEGTAVSVKAPVEQEDDEEAELRRLQAEMAM